MDEKKETEGMVYDKTPWGTFGQGLKKGEEHENEHIQDTGMESKSSEGSHMSYPESPSLDLHASGTIPIFLLKETQVYPNTPDAHEVLWKDMPGFLQRELERSLEGGPDAFVKTVAHYEKILLGAASPKGEFHEDLKTLFAEAKGIKSRDELREFWKKITNYHHGIELLKPKGKSND